MSTMTLKRLPSADWLAFGVALAAVFLKYLAPSLLGIIALVVFLPSILREVGVLKDTDEWARGIMHRAGFHAALVVVLFVTVNYVAVMSGGFATSDTRHWPLEVQFFRSAAMWVFVVSYVIQYWGAREGVFRILVVAGIMNLAPVVAVLRPDYTVSLADALLAGAVSALLMFGLATLTRRWPRVGAGIMVALLVAAIATPLVFNRSASSSAWDFAASHLQNGIIFGVTSIALFRASAQGDDA